MSHPALDQIHFAVIALVLLKSGNLSGVRGPKKDGAIAGAPAGVVGGISEVLHAVVRKLGFAAGSYIAHPQIPVADKGRALPVGRERLISGIAAGG